MRVVVLGASGFFGRHVLPELVAAGHSVLAISRRPVDARAGIEPLAADVLAAGWTRALSGSDALINLVGAHHGHGAQRLEAVHVDVARNIVDAAQRANVRRVIQLSVFCARPDVRLAYHDTKHRGDALIQQSALDWTVLRPAIVFGPDDAFSTRLRLMIARRAVPIPGRGTALHAPVHVDDLARGIARSLQLPTTVGQTLPLTGFRSLAYLQLVRELIAASGHGCLTPHLPLWLLRLIARSTAWMAEPPISAGQLAMITEGMAGDTSASWKLLGVEPRGFSAAR